MKLISRADDGEPVVIRALLCSLCSFAQPGCTARMTD